mmetsp:Transcript_33246/g.50982  ORF Transcript_33246/g.50982 Transcript_33246/m.50982 type:complete len:93 (+) Transcript_33246:1557-1835(+)
MDLPDVPPLSQREDVVDKISKSNFSQHNILANGEGASSKLSKAGSRMGSKVQSMSSYRSENNPELALINKNQEMLDEEKKRVLVKQQHQSSH